MRPGHPRRPKLRTRVLLGVLGVTLVALVAFDIAAVTALRSYLIGQTDSQLRSVLNVYRLEYAILPPVQGRGIQRPTRPPRALRRRAQRPVNLPPNASFKVAGRQAPVPLQPFSFTLVTGRGLKAVSPTPASPPGCHGRPGACSRWHTLARVKACPASTEASRCGSWPCPRPAGASLSPQPA
jgi:hypothetical protein